MHFKISGLAGLKMWAEHGELQDPDIQGITRPISASVPPSRSLASPCEWFKTMLVRGNGPSREGSTVQLVEHILQFCGFASTGSRFLLPGLWIMMGFVGLGLGWSHNRPCVAEEMCGHGGVGTQMTSDR